MLSATMSLLENNDTDYTFTIQVYWYTKYCQLIYICGSYSSK